MLSLRLKPSEQNKKKKGFTRKLTSYRSKVQPVIDINERKKKIETMMTNIDLLNITIPQLEKHKEDYNKEVRHGHRKTLTNKYRLSKEDNLFNEDFIELDDEQIQKLQSDTATNFRQFTKNQRAYINSLKQKREELRNQITELRKNMGGTKKRHKYKRHKKH
jgi:hypothetical protein